MIQSHYCHDYLLQFTIIAKLYSPASEYEILINLYFIIPLGSSIRPDIIHLLTHA